MAYLKPSAIETKIFNKLAMHSTLWDVHTLEVARRNAVDPQRVPVVPVEYDGSLFVVSARGESDWVKNVRAAGIVRVGQKGNFETYGHRGAPRTSAPARHGIPQRLGARMSTYWKKLPFDSEHPTFKLTPS